MTNPSVLFSAFRPGVDPLRESWARFRDQVHQPVREIDAMAPSLSRERQPASRAVAARFTGSGIWRLLAPNNRELGRSSFVYATFAAAHAHVLELLRGSSELVPRIVKGPEVSSYGWVVVSGGRSAMTCSRWHPTAAAAQEAAEAALRALAFAVVSDAPLRTTSSGRRTSKATSRMSDAPW